MVMTTLLISALGMLLGTSGPDALPATTGLECQVVNASWGPKNLTIDAIRQPDEPDPSRPGCQPDRTLTDMQCAGDAAGVVPPREHRSASDPRSMAATSGKPAAEDWQFRSAWAWRLLGEDRDGFKPDLERPPRT